MFDEDSLRSAVQESFRKHCAAQTHVVLPHDGAFRAYQLHSNGTRELAALTTVDATSALRPIQPGYSGLHRARVSVSGTRALVVEHDFDVRRTPMIITDVTVCDLTTAKPLHVLPGSEQMTNPGVLLMGDFAFVGGDGHRYWHLADPNQQSWTDLPIPDLVTKRTIDFYGVAGRAIWAIDDIMAPLYALAYGIDGSAAPQVHLIGSPINGGVFDFACNDFALAYLISQSTRSGVTRSCSVFKPRDHEFATNLAAGLFRDEVDPALGALRAIALVDTTLIGAFDGVGLRTADLQPALKTPRKAARTEWSSPIPIPNGEDVIALQSVPHTQRVYAIVNQKEPTWYGFSARHNRFVESGQQASTDGSTP